jgi:hypothetical protein
MVLGKIFQRDPVKKKTGHTQEEIDAARGSEPEDYITTCQKLFYGKVTGRPMALSNQDPNMSELDQMILPNIMAGSMMGIVGGGIVCDETCPGFTPIPVEPFALPGGDVVRCQRYIPKEMLAKGWEELREYALNYQE